MTTKKPFLDRARKVGRTATAGPWTQDENSAEETCLFAENGEWIALFPHQCVMSIQERSRKDAEFIAFARNHWDAMLEVVEAAQEVRAVSKPRTRAVLNYLAAVGMDALYDALDALDAKVKELEP